MQTTTKNKPVRKVRTKDIVPPVPTTLNLSIEDLRRLWEKKGYRLKRETMMELFNLTEAQLNEALAAAEVIWGKKPHRSSYKAKVQETKRPPAVYSNRSPWGIASPGLGE